MIVSIERRIDGTLTSADSATLRVTNSLGTIIVNDIVVPPTSAGVYTYTAPTLTNGDYSARWTFVVASQADDVVYRTFSVDQPVSFRSGVTLADIERHFAPRVGPFEELVAGAGSTTNGLSVSDLQSSLDLGDYEDLYILRRGRMTDGSLIAGFVADDRQRLISTYTASSGLLVPDRAWTVAPIAEEKIELHYLKPSSELRKAVLQGLRRCYFWDTALISTIGASFTNGRTTVNLTTSLPWVNRSHLVKQVQYGTGSSMPGRVAWWRVYRQGAGIYLESAPAGPGSFYIQALRPAISLVNGAVSYTGPDDDDDVLDIDLDYAAASAHISAWMLFPHRLFPISNVGMRVNIESAAAAFTMESMKVVEGIPEYPMVNFGSSDPLMEMPLVGNG